MNNALDGEANQDEDGNVAEYASGQNADFRSQPLEYPIEHDFDRTEEDDEDLDGDEQKDESERLTIRRPFAQAHFLCLRAAILQPRADAFPAIPFPDFAMLVIYFLWSSLPSPILNQPRISYYPDRWRSLAIQFFSVMEIVYSYVAPTAHNTSHLTHFMDMMPRTLQ